MNKLPKVVILATGGTIVSSGENAQQVTGYSIDKVKVSDLVDAVPALKNVARVTVEQVSNIDSSSMLSSIWLRLAKRIETLAADPDIAGFVVTHGTDTMEETAFFLHLVLKTAKPVVMTGAMRPASALSADGPFNLYDAVRVAACQDATAKGILIVMNDRIYSARTSSKVHPTNCDAFGSFDYGCLGLIAGEQIDFMQAPVKKHTTETIFSIPKTTLPRVDIVTSHTDDDGVLVRASIAAGAQGIVHAGTGNGSIHESTEPWLFDAAEKGLLVVRASRLGFGCVTNGLAKWQNAGFIPAGTLSPQKARILLQLILTITHNPAEAAAMFKQY